MEQHILMINFFKMGKNKKTIFLATLASVLFFLPLFFTSHAGAQCDPTYLPICVPSAAETGLPTPAGGIQDIVRNVLNWMLGLVGVIAIIGFVISGFQYITAAGSEKTIEIAKRNMTYAIIGVVVALSGFVIIQAIDIALRGTSATF